MKSRYNQTMIKTNKDLGQVFTPNTIVKQMIGLITNKPTTILEPSSGNGAFYTELIKQYDNVRGLELDKTVAHRGAIIIDFFKDFGKYDLIIGNPPYVENKKITSKPTNSELTHQPNLYMYFLEKSLKQLNENGELIFIIPTGWLLATSTSHLNKDIFNNYSIQYFEVIDENV